MGKKNNSTVVENGAVYQLSNPKFQRILFRFLGIILAAQGILLFALLS